LVSIHARLADFAAADSYGLGLFGKPRTRIMDHCIKREISRFSLRHTVYHPIRAVHLPSWLQLKNYPSTMADFLLTESTSRHYRWFSLVHSRSTKCYLLAQFLSQHRYNRIFSLVRHLSIP